MDERDLETAELIVAEATAVAVARAQMAVSGVSDGICRACGDGIEAPRRVVAPFATRCLTCQQASERGRVTA